MVGRHVGQNTGVLVHERTGRLRGGGSDGLLHPDDGARNHDIHVPDC